MAAGAAGTAAVEAAVAASPAAAAVSAGAGPRADGRTLIRAALHTRRPRRDLGGDLARRTEDERRDRGRRCDRFRRLPLVRAAVGGPYRACRSDPAHLHHQMAGAVYLSASACGVPRLS